MNNRQLPPDPGDAQIGRDLHLHHVQREAERVQPRLADAPLGQDIRQLATELRRDPREAKRLAVLGVGHRPGRLHHVFAVRALPLLGSPFAGTGPEHASRPPGATAGLGERDLERLGEDGLLSVALLLLLHLVQPARVCARHFLPRPEAFGKVLDALRAPGFRDGLLTRIAARRGALLHVRVQVVVVGAFVRSRRQLSDFLVLGPRSRRHGHGRGVVPGVQRYIAGLLGLETVEPPNAGHLFLAEMRRHGRQQPRRRHCTPQRGP
mmetsp:Transcript_6874/g.28106  ORF Transcript_6874/g.28106 Transcript_6874/m.28106 type:complete len:265 (+) Transcript_6874:997-1791(+)